MRRSTSAWNAYVRNLTVRTGQFMHPIARVTIVPLNQYIELLVFTCPVLFCFCPVAGHHPKASDYDDISQVLILCAVHDYENCIVAINAFPSTTPQDKWVQSCWRGALQVSHEEFTITEHIK